MLSGLTLSTLGDLLKYFSYFFPRKQDLTFHAMETICMNCQILFSRKNKKNTINLSSAELAKRIRKVYKPFLFSLPIQQTTNLSDSRSGQRF